ncbi:MAG: hypothetical protein KF901_07140 [Myxococcales bacterium]|nr:hypothetical protein [Myxococcales bacterium]
MTDPIPTPQNERETREAIDTLLRSIRHDRSQWEQGLATLRSWLEGPRKQETAELVAAAARRERLEFQWKLEELVESVLPPPPPPPAKPEPTPDEAAAAPEPAPEPEEPAPEPPPAGAVRAEDLDLIAQDPRGFALAEHRPTGDWYFITGQDPSGQLQMRKLSLDEKRTLQAQLGVL